MAKRPTLEDRHDVQGTPLHLSSRPRPLSLHPGYHYHDNSFASSSNSNPASRSPNFVESSSWYSAYEPLRAPSRENSAYTAMQARLHPPSLAEPVQRRDFPPTLSNHRFDYTSGPIPEPHASSRADRFPGQMPYDDSRAAYLSDGESGVSGFRGGLRHSGAYQVRSAVRRSSAEDWAQAPVPPLLEQLPLPRSSIPAINLSGSYIPAKRNSSGHADQLPGEALPTSVATVPTQTAEADPPRARIACSFCRVRKLRCDGAHPCRHCERRGMDCVYAPTKHRRKSSDGAGLGGDAGATKDPAKGLTMSKSADASAQAQRNVVPTSTSEATAKRKVPVHMVDESAKKRHKPSKSTSNGPSGSSLAIESATGPSPTSSETRQSDSSADPSTLSTSRATTATMGVSASSSQPGSDLAMIQNHDAPIPLQPDSVLNDEWWGDLLATLSENRHSSLRMVRHLLTRFVQSNAIFFGLLHAPTLFDVVSSTDGHRRADPALYLSVLAVAACDMHRAKVADEKTGDLRAASEASRRLSLQLASLASRYLQSSTMHEHGLSPATAQAASILALIKPDGSSEQRDLIHLVENTVRRLRLYETITRREPLLQDSEPDSPLYWSRPMTSKSAEAEVKYESIVRLCWTGMSHRFRRLIALPDEELDDENLPEFIQQVRPMAFWQPSLLPEHLPPPFFHSQDLMRRSAHLSRLIVSLAQLDRIKQLEDDGRPAEETMSKVRSTLASLDRLETAFVRHRPQTDAERQSVLGRTLQMFCRLHVWLRLTIWRKYGIWSHPDAETVESSSDSTVSSNCKVSGTVPLPLLSPVFHPTVEFWIGVVREMAEEMQRDFDSHVVDLMGLQSGIGDIDSLLRHTLCALDVADASGRPQTVIPVVDTAVFVLKRFHGASQHNEVLPQLDEIMIEKLDRVELRRRKYDAQLGTGQAESMGQTHVPVPSERPVPTLETLAASPISPLPTSSGTASSVSGTEHSGVSALDKNDMDTDTTPNVLASH